MVPQEVLLDALKWQRVGKRPIPTFERQEVRPGFWVWLVPYKDYGYPRCTCPVCGLELSLRRLSQHAAVHFPKVPSWEWRWNEWTDERGMVHCSESYYVYTGKLERPLVIHYSKWRWDRERKTYRFDTHTTRMPPWYEELY